MVKKRATKEKAPARIANLIAWVVGVLVSLSVGAGMAEGTLNLLSLYIPLIVTQIAGWIVVIGTVLSVIMALFGK